MSMRLFAVVGVVAAGIVAAGPVAHADGWTELEALASCSNDDADPVVVDITDDVDEPAHLEVGCNARIDLHGHTVRVDHISIAPGHTLTIDDSAGGTGFLRATSPPLDSAGIEVPAGATLAIVDGRVDASGGELSAGVGGAGIGGDRGGTVGTISITGGTVNATGGFGGAGIGAAFQGTAGTIEINGAEVTATGGLGATGIGGANQTAAGTITIINSDVTATGSSDSAGIGSAGLAEPGGSILIDGGEVYAESLERGAGIGAGRESPAIPITITNATVEARGALGSAGIGTGGGSSASSSTIWIENANVTAYGGQTGAGIGGGAGSPGGTIDIVDSIVVAIGGGDDSVPGGAAGIGGGGDMPGGAGGTITIDGGNITATGAYAAAGIGGGTGGATGEIHIESGVVDATGGELGAGIGSGGTFDGEPFAADGTITIAGGSVAAHGGLGGAGIGGGAFGGGQTIAINGGTVHAVGGPLGAGIGGGADAGGGGTTIRGGTVTANGGTGGAGIGGGIQAPGGDLTMEGGTVTATGGEFAPGVGSTAPQTGATRIDDGTLLANGGANAAGIGVNNCNGELDQALLLVGPAATVVATAGAWDAPIPCPNPPAAIALGGPAPALQVRGTLRLVGGVPIDVPDLGPLLDHALVTPSGEITGPAADPTSGPGFSGPGRIDNLGVIAFAETLVDTTVTTNNYLLTFEYADDDTVPIRVYAPTFSSGYRTAPTPPDGYAWAIQGQNAWFTGNEQLTGPLTLVLVDTGYTLEIEPLDPIVAGNSTTIVATARDAFGPIDTPSLAYSSNVSSDTLTPSGVITATQAGTRTITVRDITTGDEVTTELDVLPGPVHELTLVPSATSVPEGGSVTFTVTGVDEYGNPVDTSAATLSSSVATDQIDGLTVTFPTASPHVITATLDDVSTAVTIEVVPPATTTTSTTTTTTSTTMPTTSTTTLPMPPPLAPQLPATGGSSQPLVLAATLLIAGCGILAVTRRRL